MASSRKLQRHDSDDEEDDIARYASKTLEDFAAARLPVRPRQRRNIKIPFDAALAASVSRLDFDGAIDYVREGARFDVYGPTFMPDLCRFLAKIPDARMIREILPAMPAQDRPMLPQFPVELHAEMVDSRDSARMLEIVRSKGIWVPWVNEAYSAAHVIVYLLGLGKHDNALLALREFRALLAGERVPISQIVHAVFATRTPNSRPVEMLMAKELIDMDGSNFSINEFFGADIPTKAELTAYLDGKWRRTNPVEFPGAENTILTTIACAKRVGVHLPVEMWQHIFGFMDRRDFARPN